MKKCRHCKEIKEISEFNKNARYRDGVEIWCKSCRYTYLKEYYKKNKEKESRRHRERYADYGWKNALNKLYGKGAYKYRQKQFELQRGCCAVCGRHESELKHRLCLDHNHRTERWRGLLCEECNSSLGKLKCDEGTALLDAAKSYIKQHESV